jgi:hypothetical protein
MIITNDGLAPVTLVLNGLVVTLHKAQEIEVTTDQYNTLKKIFPALAPKKSAEKANKEEVVSVAQENKPSKKKKKAK